MAEKIGHAAREVDQSMAQETEAAVKSGAAGNEAEAAKKALEAKQYLPPEKRIPGWTETASGTLLDSYSEPEPEADKTAEKVAKTTPDGNPAAAEKLSEAYVTPDEAQQKLGQKLSKEQRAIAQAVVDGKMSPEDAKRQIRAQLSPEDQAYMDKVDKANQDLKAAQNALNHYNGMVQVQAGQDAEVILDGVAKLSSANNVIEDSVDGVDLTLKGTTEKGKPPAEVGIDYDRDKVHDSIVQFVNAYNQFYQTSKQLSSVDPTTGEAGPLAGDSIVRSADSRLKGVFSSEIQDAPEGLKRLTEFGITTTRQGDLEINEDLLNRQLNNHFNELGDFFGGNHGFAKRVEDAIQSMTGVTGSIRTRENTLTDRNYRLNDEQAALDRRMDQLEKRTHSKLSAMQDATRKMHGQLAGMMNALGQ